MLVFINVSGKVGRRLLVLVNPLALRSTFISGRAQFGSWVAIVIFEHSVPVRCHVHEQINMAYRNDIVQCDCSFCDENCRLWIDVELNQLEIREFSSDSTKASGCRFTLTVGPLARFGQWF